MSGQKPRRRIRWLLVIGIASGCAREPELVEVALPDLANYSVVARTDLETARLEATRSAPGGAREERAAAWAEYARRLHAYELFSLATVAYENALKLEPGSPGLDYLKGQAELKAGNLEGAKASLARAVDLAPDDLPATIAAATVALARGELERAEELAERATKLAPRSSVAHYTLGQVLSAREQHLAAARSYETALALEPEATAIAGLLAGALARAGDVERSRVFQARDGSARPSLADPLLSAVQELREDPQRLLEEGWRAFNDERFADAERAYSRAVELDDGNAEAFMNRGAARFRLGEVETARADFGRAIALDPALAAAQVNLGILEATRGDDVAAVDRYRRALILEPANADTQFNAGNSLRRLGRHAEALTAYEASLALQPVRVSAILGAAASQHALGRAEQALARLDRALAVLPESEELALARFRLWSVDSRRRPANAPAPAEVEKSLLAAPESYSRLKTLALTQAELGNYAASAKSLRRALALLPPGKAGSRTALEKVIERLESGRPAIDPLLFEPGVVVASRSS